MKTKDIGIDVPFEMDTNEEALDKKAFSRDLIRELREFKPHRDSSDVDSRRQ